MPSQSRKHRARSDKPRGKSAWTAERRFWDKVSKTDTCWIWTGSTKLNGYGSFRVGKKETYAHRYSYAMHNGDIGNGMFVCHRCDVRNCVNPEHLFLGTVLDNNRDMWNKGRGKGLDPHNGKLNDEQRKEIVQHFNDGKDKTSIAMMYNITRQAVHYWVKRSADAITKS